MLARLSTTERSRRNRRSIRRWSAFSNSKLPQGATFQDTVRRLLRSALLPLLERCSICNLSPPVLSYILYSLWWRGKD